MIVRNFETGTDKVHFDGASATLTNMTLDVTARNPYSGCLGCLRLRMAMYRIRAVPQPTCCPQYGRITEIHISSEVTSAETVTEPLMEVRLHSDL